MNWPKLHKYIPTCSTHINTKAPEDTQHSDVKYKHQVKRKTDSSVTAFEEKQGHAAVTLLGSSQTEAVHIWLHHLSTTYRLRLADHSSRISADKTTDRRSLES